MVHYRVAVEARFCKGRWRSKLTGWLVGWAGLASLFGGVLLAALGPFRPLSRFLRPAGAEPHTHLCSSFPHIANSSGQAVRQPRCHIRPRLGLQAHRRQARQDIPGQLTAPVGLTETTPSHACTYTHIGQKARQGERRRETEKEVQAGKTIRVVSHLPGSCRERPRLDEVNGIVSLRDDRGQ